jgi:uncharacterized protein YndB with AHSA1/START domain
MNVGKEFIITRVFDAPRELVFQACTEPNHLAQWWGPKGFSAPVCEWEARPGGKVLVVMRSPDGADYPMGGQFREVQPPERMVVMTGALDEQGKYLFQFLHTMTLVEKDGKTTLTMHSKIIMTTEPGDEFIGGFEEGMTMSLARLSEHLAGKTVPLVVERIFAAPVEVVWKALTDVEQMRVWYFELSEFKPVVGFEFSFLVEHQERTYDHRCQVTEVIIEKRLAYTWRYAGHPGDSLVAFDFYAEGSKTRLRVTHTGLETFPATAAFPRENFEKGWNSLLGDSLREFLEKDLTSR